jgi:hypothetical protein
MNAGKIILGFIPLALFAVLAAWIPVGFAAIIGLVASLIVLVINRSGGIKTLPLATAIILAIIAITGFVGGAAVDTFLLHYARGLAALILGVFILITATFAPFTAQFARQMVPKEHWNDQRFKAINRRLSSVWGIAVVVLGVCHLIDGAIVASGTNLPNFINLVLNWGAPIVVVLLALKYTTRITSAQSDGPAVASPVGNDH